MLTESEIERMTSEMEDEERPVDGVSLPPNLIRDNDLSDHINDNEEDRAVETERPFHLGEDFYEIEAVRRRRVHRGQSQYLIKWRGWPETANTWEPLSNLLQCPEVIHAFEERLGKNRKRKRKSGSSVVPPKKKKQHHHHLQQQHHHHQRFALTSNIVPSENAKTIDESVPSGMLNIMDFANTHVSPECSIPFGFQGEDHLGNAGNPGKAMLFIGNEPANPEERKTENELDVEAFKCKGVISTQDCDTDNIAVQCQETGGSDGGCTADGLSKATVGLVQTDRCTGARRRKSGSVKRFKQDSVLCAPNATQDGTGRRMSIGSCSTAVWVRGRNPDSMFCGSPHRNESDDSRKKHSITEIIEPIGVSPPTLNSVRDVSVTFLAMRSDGKEVTVDNNYLKANNPLLLIKFYEQHLRYNTAH